jgi:23S rRNA U2552 (ribose-2'-O)-methylase RlmE/FtsJ
VIVLFTGQNDCEKWHSIVISTKAQQEAELEKLRARAFNKMIELAEETFNIPIRKKSGTKQ